MAFEQEGGLVAQQLEGVAPLDEGEALRQEALELDRADLGAVLLGLASPLLVLVVVERALDALGGTVEEGDLGPQEIG